MTTTERKQLENELYTLKRTASLSDQQAMARIREVKAQLGITNKPHKVKGWLNSDCRKYAKDLL